MHFQPIQRTQTLKFSKGACPRTLQNGLIKISSSPPSWLLPCAGALQAFWVQPFTPLFSAISHHRHRHRQNGKKKTVFVYFSINYFARYEFCIVFGSFKVLKLRVFSFLRTFLFEFSCKRIRHLRMEEVHKHSMRTGKQRLRKRLVYKKKSS